ncbi:MAG TPA: MOSC domain-containing protein [Longimicrobiales bacterium]|nr:MOSC domain-containing protein [Longimicrobiales bacterium]
MAGRVEAIWLKRSVGGVMDGVPEATAVAEGGLEGDASFGRSSRQVTIIEKETFDRVRARLPAAEPVMRRANVMVSGLPLAGSTGRVLVLGEARVLVRGETRPCERMDAQCPGLRAALGPEWGGGAHGLVLEGGAIRVGDAARLEPPA